MLQGGLALSLSGNDDASGHKILIQDFFLVGSLCSAGMNSPIVGERTE